MPPKGKGKKKEASKEEPINVPPEKHEPTEREIQLRSQLESITDQLKTMRMEVEELRQENDFLQQESQQIKVETHEYLGYISKKAQKRQSAVITLSDRNAEKIKEIESKKEEMLTKFDKEKGELSSVILSKESELKNIQKDLEDLTDYQVLQKEQQQKITLLERKLTEMRAKHNDSVQRLKAKFLEEKNAFEEESEAQLRELSQEAKKEASNCLQQHSFKIKRENRELRQELLHLIQKTRALHKHKLELEEQKKTLVRERQYSDNMDKLKLSRDKKMYKTFGLDDEYSDNIDKLKLSRDKKMCKTFGLDDGYQESIKEGIGYVVTGSSEDSVGGGDFFASKKGVSGGRPGGYGGYGGGSDVNKGDELDSRTISQSITQLSLN